MSYQSDVTQMQGAGFSGQEIQNWSDNQAVQLRQAGFSQQEVDQHQGMVAPTPGTPPVYGRLPTDDDFKNAATVMINGNDHPNYDGAVDRLKDIHATTGVGPEEAVKLGNAIPSFRSIMETSDKSTLSQYWQDFARSVDTTIASGAKGLAELSNPDPNTQTWMSKPLFTIGEEAKKPEDYWLYQKGAAFQQMVEKNLPPQPEFDALHPTGSSVAKGLGMLPVLMAPAGIGIAGMVGSAADTAYQDAKQAGKSAEDATTVAAKSGALWGALSVVDAGAFLKPIQRAAPGFSSWVVAKGLQALRGGAVMASTNEFGDYLNSEIEKAAEIPAQYKPTLQRIITNALIGSVGGLAGRTPVREGAPSAAETVSQEREPPPPQPPTAPSAQLTPAYHFDTDSYGLKNEKGEFTQTGFGSEAEAQNAARQEIAPRTLTARIEPEEMDKYKKQVSEQAENLGFDLTPQQIDAAAQKLAESKNQVEPAKGPGPIEEKEPTENKTPYTTIPKKPLGLADFVRRNGGVNDEGGDVRATLGGAKYRPGLVNGEGMGIDDMARAAHEAGYFPENGENRPIVNDFLDKLSNDLHGRPQHSEHDANAAEAYNNAIRHNHEIDRLSNETGIRAEGKTHTQFWDEVTQHYSKEEANAKKSDFAQRANDAYESWRTEALEPEEMQTKEELSHERTQDNIAKDQKSIAQSAISSGPSARNAGKGEAIGGLGGRGVEPAGGARPGEESGAPATAVRTESGEAGGNVERSDENLKEELLYHKISGNGILSMRYTPEMRELENFVKKISPNSRFSIRNDLLGKDHEKSAIGSYDPMHDLITVSLTAPDKFNTGAHEALHSITHLLTDGEYKKLVNEGLDRKLIEKYNIEKNYSDRPDLHQEEMIAHWFGEWASDKRTASSQDAKGIFEKIKDIISQIGQKIRQIFGSENSEDIFNKIYSGEVGERTGERLSEERELYHKTANEKDEKPTLGDAVRGIRDTFSPTSAGEKAKQTEISIRGAYGEAKRERAVAETALNEFARQAARMTPEQHSDFYNYVEGRTTGAQLKNKQFQAMADAVRGIYQRFKGVLQAMPETRMMNFVTDYFTHQWADGQEEKVKDFMNTWWQQGSGRNLKERKIPTIADGLDFGLKLAEPNPVRAVSRYAGSMSNYIASVKVLRAINNDLGGGYFADGRAPEGYAPMVGRNAERIENARIDPESGKLIPARNLKLYAPKQVADLYNAFYSKGFEDSRLKPAYMLARDAINTNTMLELGLSAYHFSTITMQSLNQDMGRFLRNALAGDWEGVGDAVKGLVTPGLHFREGSKLEEQYKDLGDHGIDMEKMADQFAKSNLRLGIDPLSNISTHGGFYKAWQRGELPDLINKLKSQMTEGYGVGALKSGAQAVGRVVSDVAHPLFNVYIPAIKMSAFHDLMGDWMRQNPGASDLEIAKNRVRIGDLIEDRFGEMNMENLFWNKKAKEALGLALRAPGWDLGLVRQVGGAGYDVYRMIKDGMTKQGFDPGRLDRPLFMVGAAITYAAINSAMTYIKTGTAPSDQKVKDLIAYATGGMHQAFGRHPERAELPGHGRELIQMAPVPGEGPLSGVTQEAANKVATLPKKTWEAATNTDWNGKPIYDPKSKNWVQRIPGVAQAVHIASGFEPFSMEQLFEGQAPGSKLSLAERFMGVRAADAKIVNPEGLAKFNKEKKH